MLLLLYPKQNYSNKRITDTPWLHSTDCLEHIDSLPYRGYVFHDQDYTMRTIAVPTPPENVDGRAFHHGRLVQQLRKVAMDQST